MAEIRRRHRKPKEFMLQVTLQRVPMADEPAIDAWYRSMGLLLELANQLEQQPQQPTPAALAEGVRVEGPR